MKDSQPIQLAFHWEAEVKPRGLGARVDAFSAKPRIERPMCGENLMEERCERGNRRAALQQVRANQGSPGIDDMRVDELPDFLKAHGLAMKEQLLQGTYQPRAIKRVEIPKPGSQEKRQLGIPCVLDRLIQQAMLQVLQWRWDPPFSACSDGFRPGRSAHQAVAHAQAYLEQGSSYVVDIDLETLFDRVCLDRLRSHLAQRITDKRVLTLTRALLQAGI